MPDKKKAEGNEKKKRGRRSYALEEMLAHLDDIEKRARDGATEGQIAEQFGICRQTFSKYKNQNDEIFNAIKKGRVVFVEDLKSALVKKAKGFTYEEKKIVKENGVVVREEIYKRASLPDVAALNLLLKNYDRENWSNDPAVLELRKKELELKEKQFENNEW